MVTEQLIRQNKAHHQELLHEAERNQALNGLTTTSLVSEMLARTGDFLVTFGQRLQQRYRQAENDMVLGSYNDNQRLERIL